MIASATALKGMLVNMCELPNIFCKNLKNNICLCQCPCLYMFASHIIIYNQENGARFYIICYSTLLCPFVHTPHPSIYHARSIHMNNNLFGWYRGFPVEKVQQANSCHFARSNFYVPIIRRNQNENRTFHQSVNFLFVSLELNFFSSRPELNSPVLLTFYHYQECLW